MIIPKCILDFGCDSTAIAEHSVGFPRSLATPCSRYLGCHRQVLHLCCRDRRHHRIHLHCPTSIRPDDQVSVELFTSARNHALTSLQTNNMNAVKRLLYYTDNIEQEREIEENKSISEKWPQRGEIEFSGVKMSHRPGLPLALKGMDLKIKQGEHVGIVGRTGAGKSSIIAALFRMMELESGTITIDGVDTSRVPLQKLRNGLSSSFSEFPQLSNFSRCFDSHPTGPTPLRRHNTKKPRPLRSASGRDFVQRTPSNVFGRRCGLGGGNGCVL